MGGIKVVFRDIFVYGSLFTLVLLFVKLAFPLITTAFYLDLLLIFLFVAGIVKVVLE